MIEKTKKEKTAFFSNSPPKKCFNLHERKVKVELHCGEGALTRERFLTANGIRSPTVFSLGCYPIMASILTMIEFSTVPDRTALMCKSSNF